VRPHWYKTELVVAAGVAGVQAARPMVAYFTFGDKRASRLQEVTEWILREGWTVGSSGARWPTAAAGRTRHETQDQGLFDWLLPPPDHGELGEGRAT